MPNAPLKRCPHPGCTALVAVGRCAVHARVYDRETRSKWAAFYRSTAWRALRRAKLIEDPLCQIQTNCAEAPACEVDHIVPIEHEPELRLEWSNLQSACHACHSAKTMRESGPNSRGRG